VDRLADFDARVRSHAPRPGENEARVQRIAEARFEFGAAMDDDLNLPGAMGTVFSLIRVLNRDLDDGELDSASFSALVGFLDEVDDVLGVLELVANERAGSSLGEEDRALLDLRRVARERREWSESDRLREVLAGRGILVEDTGEGQRWRRL
jgi:cysteinyl-tRNA synthetase